MTLRSFRKRPPFVFTNDARPINLPCDPKITQRGTAYYPEFHMFPGPEALGVTGDNSLRSLIGRTWAILFCDNNDFYLLQWDGSGWVEREDSLLPVPEFVGTERRFTAAFDQSARLVYAYEVAGVIKVTRWDPGTNEYLQNVSVTGVDSVVAFDATWAYNVTVSDVLLFYLDAATRSKVMCRVQRDVYGIEYELHDFGVPVVLDRVVRLPLRYEVLASDAAGNPLTASDALLALVSDLYPYPGHVGGTSTANSQDGAYELGAIRAYQDELVITSATAFEGLYESLINFASLGTEAVEALAVALDGAYQVSVEFISLTTAELVTAAEVLDGTYALSVQRANTNATAESIASAEAQDGTYAL